MQKFLKCLIIIAITFAALYLFFVFSLDLRKESDRVWGDYKLSPSLKERVEIRTNGVEQPGEIIAECCEITTDYLSFAHSNQIDNKKANCIGYARLTSALLNHAFRKKNIAYKAKPVVGTVHSFGVNLNNVSQYILPSSWRPFFKDHDFVEINIGKERIYVDTSLSDLTGRKFVLHEEK